MGRPKTKSAPPETEVKLQELQRQFMEPDCPQSVKDDYFMLLRTYARSLTLKEIKRKGITLPPEKVDEICTDATLLLLNQYRREGWRVEASFAGALRWKVIEALYGKANDDMNYSLNRTFTEDSNSKEMLDLVSNASTPWSHHENSILYEDPADSLVKGVNVATGEINRLIDQAYEILPYPTFMRFLPWLLLQLRKPRTRNVQMLYNKLFLTNKEENAFDILLLEMRNRIYMFS